VTKKAAVPKPRAVKAPRRRDSRPSGTTGRIRVPWAWRSIGVAAALILGAGVYGALGRSGSSLPLEPVSVLGSLHAAPVGGPVGPEGVRIPIAKTLAPAGWLTLGETRDGITCQPIERLAYHIHVHLTIFVNGLPRLIPYGIGIAPPRTGINTPNGYFIGSGSCFAWLHTHAGDGIIHVESPAPKTYTLGDFFDIWREPLGPARLSSATGPVTAFYNGHYYRGNPREIPLRKHAQIQLDLGNPLIAPETIIFPNGL
jgi:hypothetical protein